jgi:CysZ protein
MFASLGRALASFFDPALWGMIVKALLLTIVLFVVIVVGIEYLLHFLPTLGAPWVNRTIEVLAPILTVLGLLAAGGPVAAMFASLYLDRVADAIENRTYPGAPKAKGMSLSTSLSANARLAGAVILVDLLLLPAEALAPGAGEIVTIIANGFLLGREYFELAALRHLEREAADALRKRNAGRIFVVGLIVSALSYVPFADIIAPLFGAAMMVHLYQRVQREPAR